MYCNTYMYNIHKMIKFFGSILYKISFYLSFSRTEKALHTLNFCTLYKYVHMRGVCQLTIYLKFYTHCLTWFLTLAILGFI